MDKLLIMGGGVVVALILMAISLKKQTFYQFNYVNGGAAFDVCEAGPENARAPEFVRAVAAAIAASAPRSREG